jgi:hypothetical protein
LVGDIEPCGYAHFATERVGRRRFFTRSGPNRKSSIVRAKLKQAVLYIERNPKLVRSITSFPYIVNSL